MVSKKKKSEKKFSRMKVSPWNKWKVKSRKFNFHAVRARKKIKQNSNLIRNRIKQFEKPLAGLIQYLDAERWVRAQRKTRDDENRFDWIIADILVRYVTTSINKHSKSHIWLISRYASSSIKAISMSQWRRLQSTCDRRFCCFMLDPLTRKIIEP